MLKHIKLSTISKLFVSLMLLTCIILSFGTLFLDRNISLIGTNWELFQANRSEKARLESALRTAIGYGGMIHDFKNYILRQEPEQLNRVQLHIGAAKAVLSQYADQDISTAEKVALEDINTVIERYEKALLLAAQLIAEGNKPIHEIDTAVKVDDAPALRGLQMLRQEVRQSLKPDAPLSKARISADLRATIGYGGLIHAFKNYVLRHDAVYLEQAKDKFQQAQEAITQYRLLTPTTAEALALTDIETTLLQYKNNLETASQLISTGAACKKIDQAVRVDDQPALRGLKVLNHEISRQLTTRSNDVSEALMLVERTLNISTWGVICLLLVISIFLFWLIQHHVITPLFHLTKDMAQLANNDLTIKFYTNYQVKELLDTMRTLMMFRDNMAKQHKTEKQLTDAYDAMSKHLDELQEMRARSEMQATKALSLAEGMAAARESAEQAKSIAEEERHRVHSILDGVRDAIITINMHGIIESINPATEEIFGYQEIEMIGKNISMLMPESMRNQHDIYVANFAEGHAKRAIVNPYEQTAQRKDGTSITVDVTLNTMTITNELKIMGVLRDITERKQREDEIKRLAMTDPLTGLANRNHYTLQLEGAAALSKRNKQPFALLLIDLDKFKPVNDTYGHAIGDALLQHVAQTLVSCCREVDTIARLGGDEFAIILVPAEKNLDAATPAQRIIDQLSQQVLLEEHAITIGASIGISYYPTNSSDIEELQRQADAALYQAKENGRNIYQIFQSNTDN